MNTQPAPPAEAQLELFDEAASHDPVRAAALQSMVNVLSVRLLDLAYREARVRRQERTRATWHSIREALGRRVVGSEELLDRLSLIAVMHLRGCGTHRLLLCGPAGAGKSYIARTLADVIGCAYHVQDVQSVSESGWHALTIESMLEAWSRREIGGIRAIEKGALVLEELGKIRVHAEAHGNAIDKRRGSQMALLALLGTGTPVALGVEGRQVSSDRMLIIMTEAFTDAPWGVRAPTPQELRSYGLAAELLDRITDVIYLGPQPPHLLARIYAEGPTSVSEAELRIADELGYILRVDEGTYRYAAIAVHRGDVSVGQRAGGFWVAAAARRALTRALRDGLPPGSVVTVTPDDLDIPKPGNPGTGGPPLSDDEDHPPRVWR